MKEAMVTNVVTKSSSIVGKDFRIQTIQNFNIATTIHRRKPITWIVCLANCKPLQIGSDNGPYHTLIKSANMMMA